MSYINGRIYLQYVNAKKCESRTADIYLRHGSLHAPHGLNILIAEEVNYTMPKLPIKGWIMVDK